MSVEQLEDGVMALWRDTWNAEAFARRKRYYKELLRGRRRGAGSTVAEEVDEFFALPSVSGA